MESIPDVRMEDRPGGGADGDTTRPTSQSPSQPRAAGLALGTFDEIENYPLAVDEPVESLSKH